MSLGKTLGNAILGIVSFGCIIMYALHFYNQSFYNSAIEVDAPITNCSNYSKWELNSEGKEEENWYYSATIVYKDKSGKEYTKSFTNERGSCMGLGGYIKIFYNPNNPYDLRLPPIEMYILHIITGVFMGGSIIIFFVLREQ